jgi:hypothetical protein
MMSSGISGRLVCSFDALACVSDLSACRLLLFLFDVSEGLAETIVIEQRVPDADDGRAGDHLFRHLGGHDRAVGQLPNRLRPPMGEVEGEAAGAIPSITPSTSRVRSSALRRCRRKRLPIRLTPARSKGAVRRSAVISAGPRHRDGSPATGPGWDARRTSENFLWVRPSRRRFGRTRLDGASIRRWR